LFAAEESGKKDLVRDAELRGLFDDLTLHVARACDDEDGARIVPQHYLRGPEEIVGTLLKRDAAHEKHDAVAELLEAREPRRVGTPRRGRFVDAVMDHGNLFRVDAIA